LYDQNLIEKDGHLLDKQEYKIVVESFRVKTKEFNQSFKLIFHVKYLNVNLILFLLQLIFFGFLTSPK
jgi:hypothetical protein